MANNRMYLRCKGCGQEFFMGKRFGEGYHIGQYDQYKGVSLIDRLNKFYADHVWCGEAGLDCFELVYEDPPAADVPRWIPVTERLPEEMEIVLVTDGKNVCCSFCVNNHGTKEFYVLWPITHWMPLPEPPKEESCSYDNTERAVPVDAINSIPADARPVKRGKWLRTPTWWVYCSVCGQEPPNETNCMTKFCPNCGAMMEES